MMEKRKMGFLTVASMALATSASAGENPFQMVEFGEGITVAGEARDMQGNKVMINDETGFTYGGDGMAQYANGKLGTGTKDPSVCGTFSGGSCSMTHLSAGAKMKEAAKGAASEAAGKMMDKAKGMMDKM